MLFTFTPDKFKNPLLPLFMRKILLLFLIGITVACSTSNEARETEMLIGSWRFIDYTDAAAQIQSPTPETAGDIILTFKEIGFEGTTGRNDYLGMYAADSKNLTFSEFGISEVAETEQGEKYLNVLQEAYDPEDQRFHFKYTIEEDMLNLQYSNSGFLMFRRIR